MFFRPGAGFAESFESRVPLATAQSAAVAPYPVKLDNGKTANLWLVKIPLDPARLTAFDDMDIVEVELTKKVHQFRSYPDPFIYGWHQGGPPSSVHIFAATLHESPIRFQVTPDRFGHVWTAPAIPGYTATLTNRSAAALTGKLTMTTKSHDQSETTEQNIAVALNEGETRQLRFSLPVRLNGHHDLSIALDLGALKWTEKRSFVRLAPDTRTERWTEGKGALFGYWSYHGGHHTPKADRHVELMTAAGARTSIGVANKDHPLVKKHWGRVSAAPGKCLRRSGRNKIRMIRKSTRTIRRLSSKRFRRRERPCRQNIGPIMCISFLNHTSARVSPRAICRLTGVRRNTC